MDSFPQPPARWWMTPSLGPADSPAHWLTLRNKLPRFSQNLFPSFDLVFTWDTLISITTVLAQTDEICLPEMCLEGNQTVPTSAPKNELAILFTWSGLFLFCSDNPRLWVYFCFVLFCFNNLELFLFNCFHLIWKITNESLGNKAIFRKISQFILCLSMVLKN